MDANNNIISAFVRLCVDEVGRAGAGRRLVRGLAAARPAFAEVEEEEEEEGGHTGAPEAEHGLNAPEEEEEENWDPGPQDVENLDDAGQEAGEDDGGRGPPGRRGRGRGGRRPLLPRRAGFRPLPGRQPEVAPKAPAPPALPAEQLPARNNANRWEAPRPEFYELQRVTVTELGQGDAALLGAMVALPADYPLQLSDEQRASQHNRQRPPPRPEFYELQRVTMAELGQSDAALLDAMVALPADFPLQLSDEQRARFAREFLALMEAREPVGKKIACIRDSWCTITPENTTNQGQHFNQDPASGGPHVEGKALLYCCPVCPFRASLKRSVIRHLNDKEVLLPEVSTLFDDIERKFLVIELVQPAN
ncbi:hypothetical protein TYRP_022914 [Tyrophagus putrescentiae]|nr:hypothetical protein TYRP_022914 [Tyrophagus putrescentiae]